MRCRLLALKGTHNVFAMVAHAIVRTLQLNQGPINQAPMPLTIAFGLVVDDHGVDLADKPQAEFGTYL